jgi:hypothetical protein
MRPPLGVVFAVALAGCFSGMPTGPHTAGEIHECAADDFATGHVVFFGLSNLGPGTVMRQEAGQVVVPAYLFDSISSQPRSTVIHLGVDWNCALGDSLTRVFGAKSAVGMLPVDPSLNAQLARASQVVVSANSVRWDDLLAAPYQSAVARLNDGDLKADLLVGRYLVVSRALAANGVAITVRFDRSIGADVRAALGDGPKDLRQGKVSARVNLAWEGTTALVITALSEVYIAGQFRPLGSGRSTTGGEPAKALDPIWQTLLRSGS